MKVATKKYLRARNVKARVTEFGLQSSHDFVAELDQFIEEAIVAICTHHNDGIATRGPATVRAFKLVAIR